MRISELINLKKEDIDFDKKVLVIKKSKTQAGTNRIIPLHKDIIPFLKHFTFDLTYSNFNLKFKNIMFLLKVNHTIHECRHTFSTILSKTKARQHVIRAIMGHANNRITDLYIHIQLCDLIKTINLLQGKKIIESSFCKDDFYLR
jgi:integrase